MMKNYYRVPDKNRLSLIIASILLAYALSRFIDLEVSETVIQLPGIYLAMPINLRTIIIIMIIGLTSAGTSWLLENHPTDIKRGNISHTFLPALTAWVIGFPILQIGFGPLWIASFFLGGILLTLVLIGEYITIDPDDIRQPLAAAGLIVVSFGIFFIFTITIHYIGFRLIYTLPTLFISGFLVSLRALQLRFHGRVFFLEALTIALVCCHISAALHYWPISPVSYGLALLGVTYSLNTLIGNTSDGQINIRKLVGPSWILISSWLVAFLLR